MGDPDNALFGVESDPFRPKASECFFQVGNQAACFPGLDDNVVYVSLNYFAYKVPKNLEHTSLICSPRVLEAKRHGYVAIHSERGDERSRELVGLFHLDLVVA